MYAERGVSRPVSLGINFKRPKTPSFASLIHSRNLASIMVTHDLRMVEYTDRVIQMQDGQLSRITDDQEEIRLFANGHLN
jgi:putative ABC transport system ATP-binding protein